MFLFIASLGLTPTLLAAADLSQARKYFQTGEYQKCLRECEEAARDRSRAEDWPILHTRCLQETGRYQEAVTIISNAVAQTRRGIRVRLQAHDSYQQIGETQRAKELLQEIKDMGSWGNWILNDPDTMVAFGQAVLLLGADPKLVLENFFNEVKKNHPDHREAHLAIGQLALDKNDFDLAAQTFTKALEKFPGDPDFLFGIAKAFSPSDRPVMLENLQAALKQNPKHVPSLLLLVDHLIDAEEFSKAEEQLAKILEINPKHPEAWAYRAVLAHLDNKPARERQFRDNALSIWKTNPRVDHLIGLKLSQKYRFAEGSAYQRQALQWDANFLPAKIQLAQDLLRLGEPDEGMTLAEQVHQRDGYDVVAYNLVTLGEHLSRFHVLTNEHFVLRMAPREAAIYGQRALQLLQRAKDTLCAKYDIELDRPTHVEIFPEQKDFAVRTFGMPGGEGYLGVCFGCVITANSPASQISKPFNWEAVLWHEFCHVVTLALTRNKMPRWLSEGISVYEELKANPAWGQRMTPRYRQMILEGELTPISELSGAFLTPKSGLHLQFAYYQSSLVVEYLVQQFGLDALKRVLRDLGDGKPINPTLESHTAPLAKLEKDFAAFARQRAEELGSGLDWKEPSPQELASFEKAASSAKTKNYWLLLHQAKKHLESKEWEAAKRPLQFILENFSEPSGPDNPYALLATAHRHLQQTDEERRLLLKWAELDADATEAFLRLMELSSAGENWPAVIANGERFLAVNPLIAPPHRFLALAHEALQQPEPAIQSYRTLLQLEPNDLAEAHFRLARLLHQTDQPDAKRHTLQALEEAPRFQDAHELLLKIIRKPQADAQTADPDPAPEPSSKPNSFQ